MSSFQTLRYEKQGAVGHVSLDRPAAANAYNVQMRDDFSQALEAVRDDPEVRSVLLTGEGRGFCAGADLTEFGTAPSLVTARRVRWQRDVWGQLLNLDKPVVAAIHGYCIGSGLEIALLCDLRIVAVDAVFAMPELHLGMVPAAGGTQTLPGAAGPANALDLLYTGRRFSAPEALGMGLVTRLVEPGGLPEAGWQAAEELAALPPGPVAAVKDALRSGTGLPLADALGLESRLAGQLLA